MAIVNSYCFRNLPEHGIIPILFRETHFEFGYDSSMIGCYFNSIHLWLDILLPSNSEDINSEMEAQGNLLIQVKGHRKLQETI